MKILATVGTTAFDSLIRELERISVTVSDEIVVQYGPSGNPPERLHSFAFSPNIEKYYEEADVVIAHAGAGTLFKLLELGKKVIVVPNLERNDHHQLDLARHLADGKHVLLCPRVSDLGQTISRVAAFTQVPYSPMAFSGYHEISEYLFA